jgi:hypothetical protein
MKNLANYGPDPELEFFSEVGSGINIYGYGSTTLDAACSVASHFRLKGPVTGRNIKIHYVENKDIYEHVCFFRH